MKPLSRWRPKLKNNKRRRAAEPTHTATATASPVRGRPRWSRWTVAVCALALLGGLTFAALELLFDSKIPPLLQGKWVVVEGEFKGATVEFFRDATMTSNRDPASQEGTIHGTVQVEGNLLRLTTRSPLSNREITDVQIILELSDRQLVTQSVKDPKGNVLRMKRVP